MMHTDKKKLLFLIPSLGGGGAERVLVNLVNNLNKEKYDISVQTLFDVGVNRRYLSSDITYIPGLRRQFPGNTQAFKLFSPKFLYKKFIKNEYDVIISYLEGPAARIVSGCSDPNCKLVSWIHVEQHTPKSASHSFRSFAEAQKCYERFDKTICVAETVKKDFEQIFTLTRPCEVLYNTNETDKILMSAAEAVDDIEYSDEINVFSVGRLRPEKGFDRLIRAHRVLLNEGLKHHVYILGEGDQADNLRKLINEENVADTFHIMGFRDNPYKYVAKADLFICSSRREGFSTAVTEALVMGVPVVSALCSGAHELLGENNEYGIVTENSQRGVLDGLRKMLSDRELLSYYKNKAIERGPQFSKEKTVLEVERMLDAL